MPNWQKGRTMVAPPPPPIRKVTLPPLHKLQQEVATDPARFKVLACGRRWGKTKLAAALAVKTALAKGRVWWVAPSYPITTIGLREVMRLAAQIPGATYRAMDRMIIFPGGGWIQVKSASNPDSLRGEGLDLVIFDEAAFAREQAWTEALRATLSDRKGKALLICTPKGKNWFWRYFMKGQGQDPEWKSWQFPTSTNPFIDPKEVEAARNEIPEQTYQQEYLAEFLDDGGGVFKKVRVAATAIVQSEAIPGHTYVFGVDWGKSNDFTVITVYDATIREVCYMERFNQISYVVQMGRLYDVYDRFKPINVAPESNSMGQPLIDMLRMGRAVKNPDILLLSDGKIIVAHRKQAGNTIVAEGPFNLMAKDEDADRCPYNPEECRFGHVLTVINPWFAPVNSPYWSDGAFVQSLPVTPFNTTNASKKEAIEALQLAFEREEIKIPDDPTLINELQSYEVERLPGGLVRYSAPDGQHDDMVMSLAIAYWAGRFSGVAYMPNPFEYEEQKLTNEFEMLAKEFFEGY